MKPPSFLGPVYNPWWRRRLAIIFLLSLVTPAFVAIVGATSDNPDVTIGGIIGAAIIIYIVQVAFCLLIAPAWMPRELKEEWEHRRITEAAKRSRHGQR
ncbi:MAG TPA: hypothetical protein VEZ14_12825 [Dehalococcoidia bacterium]|nr:hypothetical protein [Dehalococcoidia bacterium]